MKKPKSFEDAYQRLCQISDEVNDSKTTLSDAIQLYEEAAQLKQFCDETLCQAKLKIVEISNSMHQIEDDLK